MNIKIGYIEIINFHSIAYDRIKLDDRGVVLIKGINADKGGSNGAGKSTIFNALLWCLYGKTLDGDYADDVVKVDTKGGASVTVEINIGGVFYDVTRFRQNKELGNSVVLKNEDSGDLSGCTIIDTNNLIIDLLGADFNQFISANVFCADSKQPFLSQTDKEQKASLLSTKIMGKFRDAHKKCGAVSRVLDLELVEDTGSLDLLELKYTNGAARLETAINQKKAHQQKLQECVGRYKGLEVEKRNNEKECKKLEISVCGWVARIKLIQNDLKVHTQLVTSIKIDDEIIYGYRRELDTLDSRLKERCKWRESAEKDILFVEEKIIRTEKKMKDYAEQLKERYKKLNAKDSQKVGAISGIHEMRKVNEGQNIELKKLLDARTQINNSIVFAQSTLKGAEKSIEETEIATSKACLSCKHSSTIDLLATYRSDITDTLIQIKGYEVEKEELIKKIGRVNECIESDKIKLLEYEDYLCKVTMCIDSLHKDRQAIYENEETLRCTEYVELTDKLKELKINFEPIDPSIIKAKTDTEKKLRCKELEIVAYKKSLKMCKSESLLQVDLDECVKSERHFKNKVSALNELIIKAAQWIVNEKSSESGILIEISSVEQIISNIKNEVVGVEKEIRILDRIFVLKKGKLEELKFWKEGFSSIGIESFMLDSLFNAFNVYVNEYLHILSNGTMSVYLTATSETKSGKNINKNTLKVQNPSGSKTYAGSSAGEKRIMDISAMFALKKLSEQAIGNTFNLLLMDEVFTSLDENACLLVTNFINQLEEESVFVISHLPSIYSEFSQVMCVKKEGGTSTVIEGGLV